MTIYEVFRGRDGMWRYRVIAGNGEILSHSQAYFGVSSKQNAKSAARRRAGKTPWSELRVRACDDIQPCPRARMVRRAGKVVPR